jgi:hypothetical protein
MRRLGPLGVLVGAAILVWMSARTDAQTNASGTTPTIAAGVIAQRAAIAGVWDYNALESVNAANGRPEQSPKSATTRTPGTRPPRTRVAGAPDGMFRPPSMGSASGDGADGAAPEGSGGGYGSPDGYGGSSPYSSGYVDSGLPIGLTAAMVRENRDLSRDLLEVPESLTIKVSKDAVTFVDDLDRARTYPTNGDKAKFQLGAARFDAETSWNGAQLAKRIQGRYGFKMTETYFLSANARRLFVIIRIGEPKKGEPVVGVNRVYDRVE